MELYTRLIDNAVLGTGSRSSAAEANAEHQALRARYPSELRSIVVEDHRLVELDRVATTGTQVTVLNTTGAGGLTALARRSVRNLEVVAVDAWLRDPADPAGNVARIAAAARELGPGIAVNVVLPDGPAGDRVVGDIEAEGLFGVIGHQPDLPTLARRMSVLVEADLPFSLDGVPSAEALLSVLVVLDALVDGEDPEAAAARSDDRMRSAATVGGWDGSRAARVRRRLRSVRTSAAAVILDRLRTPGPSDQR